MENNELKTLENNLLNMRATAQNASKVFQAARNAGENAACGFNTKPNQESAISLAYDRMTAAARNAVQAQNKLDEYRALTQLAQAKQTKKDFWAKNVDIDTYLTATRNEINAENELVVLAAIRARLWEAV